MTNRSKVGPPLAVDTHVHIHDCFPLERFLDAAAGNFRRAVGDRPDSTDLAGVLMLTEVHGTDVFGALAEASTSWTGQLGDWRLYSTPDPVVLLLEKGSAIPLILVAGRQIRIEDGLEVLALGTRDTYRRGLSLEDALHSVCRSGALPVVPWGFGKWTFGRGRRIRMLIDKAQTDSFCLGDVGSRWRGAAEPSQLTRGRDKGFKVLPGSDPLPFPREVDRAGSSGVVLPGSLSFERPVPELLGSLRSQQADSRGYMRLEPLPSFIKHQLLMQGRKD